MDNICSKYQRIIVVQNDIKEAGNGDERIRYIWKSLLICFGAKMFRSGETFMI